MAAEDGIEALFTACKNLMYHRCEYEDLLDIMTELGLSESVGNIVIHFALTDFYIQKLYALVHRRWRIRRSLIKLGLPKLNVVDNKKPARQGWANTSGIHTFSQDLRDSVKQYTATVSVANGMSKRDPKLDLYHDPAHCMGLLKRYGADRLDFAMMYLEVERMMELLEEPDAHLMIDQTLKHYSHAYRHSLLWRAASGERMVAMDTPYNVCRTHGTQKWIHTPYAHGLILVLKMLWEHPGFDWDGEVNRKDVSGDTPLLCAVRGGYPDSVKFLLQKGALCAPALKDLSNFAANSPVATREELKDLRDQMLKHFCDRQEYLHSHDKRNVPRELHSSLFSRRGRRSRKCSALSPAQMNRLHNRSNRKSRRRPSEGEKENMPASSSSRRPKYTHTLTRKRGRSHFNSMSQSRSARPKRSRKGRGEQVGDELSQFFNARSPVRKRQLCLVC